ncbi:hypothetical protein [Streptosporangium sp. NPDC004631]
MIFELRVHLDTHAGDGDEAFVVLGAKEAMLRRPVFFRIWAKALKEAGLSGVHFPALRHAGNTFAFPSGATLRAMHQRIAEARTADEE